MNRIEWKDKHFSFFSNRKCEYFPCHRTEDRSQFNCLFCYCPLYYYEKCGGNFNILENGVKDCSDCLIPHKKHAYGYIWKKIDEKRMHDE